MRLERGKIEGGDVMLHGNKVLVGLGEATCMEGVNALRRALAQLGNPREVIPIPFRRRGTIHLDTKFNIAGGNTAIFARDSFERETVRWFEQRFDLIDATPEETAGLAINTFSVGGGKIVVERNAGRLACLLQGKGFSPILVDYSHVIRWPGSFRCTTLPLRRSPD